MSSFVTDQEWKIFGVTTTPAETIPSNGEYSLFLTVPASTHCKISGSVGIRILTPTYINLSWEIFRDNKSITQGGQRLFAMNDPTVTSTVFREKTVNYQIDDTAIISQTNIVYNLKFYNYSTLVGDVNVGKTITIDFVSLNAVAQLVTVGPLSPSLYTYQHSTSNGAAINQGISIPPNDMRTINLQTVTSGGDCKIQGSISLANISAQNFRPVLEIDIVRDGKISILNGPQILISAPTSFTLEAGRTEFLTSFVFVDQNVPLGPHEYQLILNNQSMDVNNQPTFLELFVIHFSAMVPVIEPFHVGNQSVENFTALTPMTIGPNQSKRFNIQVPRNITQALIKGIFNMAFHHSIFEIRMALLRDGEVIPEFGATIPEFGGNQIIQVPFSGRTYEMQHSIPIVFLDSSNLNNVIPDLLQDHYTYSIEIFNNSTPSYEGADVTIRIHWYCINIIYIYGNVV